MRKFFFLFIALLFSASAFTQTTGSFEQSISFTESDYNFNRTLYYYVPSDYDANQSYKLVVGFRGGPHSNAGQFRDQLTFLSDSLNAIILCPENADHFWNQEGLTKQLFKYSVDTTMAMYNIDPEFIYLTGLSYGGRHAVIVSMDTDDGEIPALRGVIPFAAGSESDLQPNYSDIATFAPACICIGLNDNTNFQNVSNNLHNDIQTNGGKSILNEIPGVGHTVAFSTYPEEMMECFNFIEDQYMASSMATFDNDNALTVFPNPANNQLNWSVTADLDPDRIWMSSINGEVIKSFNPLDRQIDISFLANGSYFLVIETNKEKIVKRFSVLRE